jgi:hypothetical protein
MGMFKCLFFWFRYLKHQLLEDFGLFLYFNDVGQQIPIYDSGDTLSYLLVVLCGQ